MIKIQEVTITKTGNDFALYLTSDNLLDYARFLYRITNDEGETIQTGELQMSGTDYTNWNGTNTDAYTWALNELGFTRQG